jgi:hypothetical protein
MNSLPAGPAQIPGEPLSRPPGIGAWRIGRRGCTYVPVASPK